MGGQGFATSLDSGREKEPEERIYSGEFGVRQEPQESEEEVEWLNGVMAQVDSNLITDMKREAETLRRQGIISDTEEQEAKNGIFGQRYLEVSGLYKDLTRLIKWGARGDKYLDDLDELKKHGLNKNERAGIEYDPLIVAGREVEKAAEDEVIPDADAPIVIKEFAQGATMGVEKVVDEYKKWVIGKVEHFFGLGVFDQGEANFFRANYLDKGMTVFGTPRDLQPENVVKYMELRPGIEKLATAEKAAELKDNGALDEAGWQDYLEAAKNNTNIPDRIVAMITDLERIKYARGKRILKNDGEYRRAVGLLKQTEVNKGTRIEVEEPDTFQEVVTTESAENNPIVEIAQDPLHEQKATLIAAIAAWEDALGVKLMREFGEIINSNNSAKYDGVYTWLVDLVKEYYNESRSDDTQLVREKYLDLLREGLKSFDG